MFWVALGLQVGFGVLHNSHRHSWLWVRFTGQSFSWDGTPASGFHVGSGQAGDQGLNTMVGSLEAEEGTWSMVGLILILGKPG